MPIQNLLDCKEWNGRGWELSIRQWFEWPCWQSLVWKTSSKGLWLLPPWSFLPPTCTVCLWWGKPAVTVMSTQLLYPTLVNNPRRKVKSLSRVQLCNPMDCSLPGSSVHGIFQAVVLEWIAISFSRGLSQPRDQTQVSRIAGRFFTVWVTRESPACPVQNQYHWQII